MSLLLYLYFCSFFPIPNSPIFILFLSLPFFLYLVYSHILQWKICTLAISPLITLTDFAFTNVGKAIDSFCKWMARGYQFVLDDAAKRLSYIINPFEWKIRRQRNNERERKKTSIVQYTLCRLVCSFNLLCPL